MSDQSFQELKNRSLFARLKRLFSNDVIVRNVGGKKLKVIDTDEIQYATDRNSLRDRFNRLRTTSYNQYTRDFNLSYQSSRVELFRDYDTMDMDPIISSALDIYADECVTKNELGEILIIHSSNDNIKQILYNFRRSVWRTRISDSDSDSRGSLHDFEKDSDLSPGLAELHESASS